jgi:WD40 repeat protein
VTPVLPILAATLAIAAAPAPPITAIAVAPDGKQVVTASQSGVVIRSLPRLAVASSITTELPQVHDLVFSPDGKALAIVGGVPGEKGGVELWEWPAGKRAKSIAAGNDLAHRAAWSADSSQLATAGADRRLRIVRVADGETKAYECHSASVLATAWLPADKVVLSGGVDQSIRVLDPASGRVLRSLDNHTALVRDLAIRPGKHEGPSMIASCSADRTVRFWQPTIGRLVRFVRLPSPPTALCWTPSGSHVLAACEDGKLRSVDPANVEVIEFAQHLAGWAHAVAITPAGAAAILGGEQGELRLVPLDAIKP